MDLLLLEFFDKKEKQGTRDGIPLLFLEDFCKLVRVRDFCEIDGLASALSDDVCAHDGIDGGTNDLANA